MDVVFYKDEFYNDEFFYKDDYFITRILNFIKGIMFLNKGDSKK